MLALAPPFPFRDKHSVDEATKIKKYLSDKGTLIGNNDIAIAGNAIAHSYVLVTNNTGKFTRVSNLALENWVYDTKLLT